MSGTPAMSVKAGMTASGPGVDGGAERRQVDLGERAVGDVDGGVVAAGGAGAVGDEVLGRRGEAGRSAPWVPRTLASAKRAPT